MQNPAVVAGAVEMNLHMRRPPAEHIDFVVDWQSASIPHQRFRDERARDAIVGPFVEPSAIWPRHPARGPGSQRIPIALRRLIAEHCVLVAAMPGFEDSGRGKRARGGQGGALPERRRGPSGAKQRRSHPFGGEFIHQPGMSWIAPLQFLKLDHLGKSRSTVQIRHPPVPPQIRQAHAGLRPRTVGGAWGKDVG